MRSSLPRAKNGPRQLQNVLQGLPNCPRQMRRLRRKPHRVNSGAPGGARWGPPASEGPLHARLFAIGKHKVLPFWKVYNVVISC
mmetsp:Transcript_124368/g.363194  ORF Transcript_124368/g.363194 Transcript_124368/m.363194 type:complete len:84 (+) Transcript_124368:1206-1457(+)